MARAWARVSRLLPAALSAPRHTRRALALALLILLPACAGTTSVRLRNDIGDLTSDYNNVAELNHWVPREAPWPHLVEASTSALATALGLLPAPADFERRDALHLRLGQLFFVPEDIASPVPSPRDRPYAGWLYAGAATETLYLDADSARRRDQRARVELGVGIVGPSSRADDVQIQWHEAFGLTDPKGWHTQLRDEPTLLLAVQRDLRLWFGDAGDAHEWDASGHLDWNLGNVRTSANVGALVRFGKHLPRDFGFRSRPDPDDGAGGGSLFMFGDAHAIARDLFLDGNTWKDSPSVDKEPFVLEGGLGLDADLAGFQVRFGHLWRSPEFELQDDVQGVWFLEVVL